VFLPIFSKKKIKKKKKNSNYKNDEKNNKTPSKPHKKMPQTDEKKYQILQKCIKMSKNLTKSMNNA
jgi:hypothetical protein